ncbi:MAG: hypothetical protein IPG38_03415 [Chitinophagaceae bacterium]|nr:hypothetical protein [Chitinophagaceae bacterium]
MKTVEFKFIFFGKKYFPDGSIQLLDYKMQGPLKKVTTYTDIGLRVLEGKDWVPKYYGICTLHK